MNEKIMSIALEAGFDVSQIMKLQNAENLQNFAELIIRKCAQVGEDTGGDWHVSSEILKEFGLK